MHSNHAFVIYKQFSCSVNSKTCSVYINSHTLCLVGYRVLRSTLRRTAESYLLIHFIRGANPVKCPEFLQSHILETPSITPQIPYSKRGEQSESRYELDLVLIRVRRSFGWNPGVCDCLCGCL